MSHKETIESSSFPEVQDSAVQAKSFLEKMKVFSDLAEKYTKSQIEGQKMKGVLLYKDQLYSYAFGGLHACQSASGSHEKIEQIKNDYGDDTYHFLNLLGNAQDKLDKASHIGKLNKKDRLITTVQAMFFCKDPRVPLTYREELLKRMGYEPNLMNYFNESAAWTAGFLLPMDAVLSFSQTLPAVFGPHIQWSDPGAKEIVIATYALDALFLVINTYQNRKNILNPHLRSCPNVFATSAHVITNSVFPNNQLAEELSILVPSVGPTLVSELAFLLLLGLPNTGISATIYRHGLSVVNQGTQALIAQNMHSRAEKEFIKG